MYIKQMIALHRPSAKTRNLGNISQTVDYGIQHQIGRLVKNQPHTSDRRIMIDQPKQPTVGNIPHSGMVPETNKQPV